jgi:hypothetical protein
MSKRATDLAKRFKTFNDELIGFVEKCSDENWRKICLGEQWRENGTSAADYVAGLGDTDLDRSCHIAAAGGDMTAEQLIANIILRSGGEHFANAKAATGA